MNHSAGHLKPSDLRGRVFCPGNRSQLFLREAAQVAALGQVLPQQTVGVLVDAPLPGTVWIGKVDRDTDGLCQPLMRRHFSALIVRQRQTPVRLDPIEHMTKSAQCCFGAGIVHPGQHREQGGALHLEPHLQLCVNHGAFFETY